MPAEQKAEVERIEGAINDYNQGLHSSLALVIEWLWQDELRLAWLECLDGFLKRQRSRPGRAPRRPLLPPPGRGFKRDLPLVYGTRASDDEEPVPSTWQEAREQLVDDLRQAVRLRWGEYVAWRAVQDELLRELGEEMVHLDVRDLFDVVGRKVMEIKEAVERLAGPVELGHPTEAQMETARSYVDWEALKPPAPAPGLNGGRGYMTPAELAELETLEARLAAELRAREGVS